MESMKAARKLRGVSVEKLAEETGLTTNMIWSYESGRREPPISACIAIADALDVSLDLLVRGKEKTLSKERAMQEAINRLDALDSDALQEVVLYAQYRQYRRAREQSEGQTASDN